MGKETERHVAAVQAALEILNSFESARGLRLGELHARTGLTRSRILRYLGTLEASGFINSNRSDGTYELGPKAFRLGWLLRTAYESLTSLVRPRLQQLSEKTDTTAFFSVVRGDSRLVIARHEPHEGVRYVVAEGQVRSLHVGATGKILLAFSTPDVRSRVINGHPLEPLTDRTVTDPLVLMEHVEAAARERISVSFGEGTGSGFAMAVPVFSSRAKLAGALTLAGPIDIYDRSSELCRQLLREEATFLSSRISEPM
jgi:DNA-binding IclR family transcriptional regulator